jgi:fatty-acyl-CoA synthase
VQTIARGLASDGALGGVVLGESVDSDWAWLKRDLLARHAQVRPDATAIVELASGWAVSFAQFDAEVRKVAGYLQTHLSPGARVAVLSRNTLWQVALFYACIRRGAVFVPINWRLSGVEIAVLLNDCQPEIMIRQEEFARQAEDALARAPALTLLDEAGWLAAIQTAAPSDVGTADPHAPAALLYTSGTTGKPKGVMVTAKWAHASALNYTQVSELTPASVLLCDTPLFHVVGLLAALHGAMTAGARFLMSDRFVAGEVLRRLSDPQLGVTHSFCVPQMAQAMYDDPAWADADLSRLKALFSGGAPLPARLARAFLEKGVLIANGYGMTEGGTLTCMPLDPDVLLKKTESAGLPAPSVEIRLVTVEGPDAGPGEVGEIWLRGPSIMPGYWKQPEATAKAFQDGWLKTGDAARRDEDGFYYIVDRWKDMYITGGENVYPAEVEAALFEALPLSDVAVVGVPDERWGETGCAYLVVSAGTEVDPAQVADACANRLARYKHPRHIRFIDAIPRTASGKIRKDELRARFAKEQGA